MLNRLIIWFGCKTGLYHLRCKWDDKGITCVDCGYHKTKYEHLADLHAGGGW
jgi:hypothetical protein